MKELLITGTNGFIGDALCAEAVARGFAVRGTTRTVCDLPMGTESIAVGNIDASIEWHDENWCARSDSNARPLGS